MESNRDTVIRALRAAHEAATDLLDIQGFQCYDKALLQVATQLIAEAEIIIAHSQSEDIKKDVRQLQNNVEETRTHYPSDVGAVIVWLSADENSIAENPPLDVASLLDIYTETLQTLKVPKKFFHDTLCLMGTAMARQEIAEYEQELPALHGKLDSLIKEDKWSSRTGEPPSEDFQGQKQAIMDRAQQIMARIAELEATQNQPESLIQLMFY